MWRSDLRSAFLAKLPTGGRIADIGCGAGADTSFFAAAGLSVLALDKCERAIGQIPHQPNVTAVCAELETFDFELCAFSGIWACAVLCFLPRDRFEVSFDRLWLSLRRPGVLAITMPMVDSARLVGPKRLLGITECQMREFLERHRPSSVQVSVYWSQRHLSRLRWFIAMVEK
ncbi:class I SAM-dependent methyltransferase [Mesorhizobium sp.]|uniref:class I SAM-dependent methyltransferase n=1 Tax=Mesorhizobium sp. TaxID=1871066 RepID=UPI000FE4CC31|nr:MAG: class I SAM-dependent methyltransferase [Mesorhizobium sp.]